ncbi:MAG: metalloregulator ArsR/SmtB family transcription factor [Candidatus Methanoplasma sp.]|jgi:ArsR family transcriptional regulator|nr:metalloregulator ArsR/SmtB family transcription factor [Candidatus Methanoplasma sp.]
MRGTPVENDHENNARVFKAFCDVNRLKIIEMLQSGEKCACVILENVDISQPTLSHRMKVLCDSGIVLPRKAGKWTHYSISEEGRNYAIELLRRLTDVTAAECFTERCCE